MYCSHSEVHNHPKRGKLGREKQEKRDLSPPMAPVMGRHVLQLQYAVWVHWGWGHACASKTGEFITLILLANTAVPPPGRILGMHSLLSGRFWKSGSIKPGAWVYVSGCAWKAFLNKGSEFRVLQLHGGDLQCRREITIKNPSALPL